MDNNENTTPEAANKVAQWITDHPNEFFYGLCAFGVVGYLKIKQILMTRAVYKANQKTIKWLMQR